MDKYKAFEELIEHLEKMAKNYPLEKLGVVAHLDYYGDPSKSHLRFYFEISNKVVKTYNPCITFLTKKQPYFKNEKELIIFFINEVFDKDIDLHQSKYKPFSNYRISLKDLEKKKFEKVKKYFDETILENQVNVKKIKL